MHILSILSVLMACRSEKGITSFNDNPAANITSHSDGSEVLEGYSILLRGAAFDTNNQYDELMATWYSGTEIICEAEVPLEDGSTECEVVVRIEDSEFILEVRDAENATDSAFVNLTVIPTESPEVEIVEPMAEAIYYSDELLALHGLVMDTEDSAQSLIGYWRSSLDGVLEDVLVEPDSLGEVIGYSLLSEGQHVVELHIEDSTGKTGVDSVVINVGPPNTAPLCEITDPPTGSAGAEWELVQFYGFTSDVDVSSDYLTVDWHSDKDGPLGNSTPNTSGGVLFSYSELSVNTHTISLNVMDEAGLSCSTFIEYTVGTAPNVEIVSPLVGDILNEGEPIVFSASVSDAQDVAEVISLEWMLDGIVLSNQSASSSGTAIFTDSTISYGSHSLIITATDSHGLMATDAVVFLVNGLPTEPTVGIDPDPATTTDILAVNIISPSVDPEGSVIGYSYQWLKNTVSQTSQTSSTVLSSDTAKGELWTVNVTPNDGLSDGEMGTASILIQNTAPSLSAVSITPNSSVYNDLMLTCLAIGSDVDEVVTVDYSWTIDGALVGTAATLDLAPLAIVPSDSVQCAVSVTDSDGASDMDAASVTIDNRLPVVSIVSLLPAIVYTNETITAESILDDDDGNQSLTANYEWFVEGVSVQSGVSSTLDGVFYFDRDEEVYVVVTANDGIDDGVPLTSSSLFVSNTAPSSSTISITATSDPPMEGGDDLTCTVDVESTDIDGDSIEYSYVWTDASGVVQQSTSTVSALSDVFLAAGTSEGEWFCTVEPSDGTDSGSVSEASIIVEESVMCNAIEFTSLDGSIEVQNNGFGVGSGDWTFEYWVRMDGVFSGGNYLFVQNENYSSNAFRSPYDESTGMARCYTYQSTSGSHNLDNGYTASIDDGDWHHIACNYTGGTLKVYTDGLLSSTDSGAPNLSAQSTMSIGAAAGYSSYYAPSATLGPIRFSSAARYPSEFTPEVDWPVDSDTIAQYLTTTAFDGVTLIDEAGGDNNGTHRQDVVAVEECITPSTCAAPVTYTVSSLASGKEVQGVVIGDIDGDGFEDAAFNEQLDNNLQLYWGDGTGYFSSSNRTTISLGRSGGPGAIGDIDNDGDNDLVWGLQDSNTLKYITNNGARSFSVSSEGESGGPRNLELYDVNSDGNLDLFTYRRFGSCVSLKMGNGDGTFQSSTCVTADRYSFDVADVDNDGLGELITNQGGVLYMNELDSSGQITSTYTMGFSSSNHRFYDVDADGYLDLFVYESGTIYQYINDGQGNFSGCSIISGLSNGWGDVGDFNNDNKIDYAYYTTCGYCNSINYFAVQD